MQKSITSQSGKYKDSPLTPVFGFRSEDNYYNRLLVDHFGLDRHQLAFERIDSRSPFLNGEGSNPVIIISRASGFKGKVTFAVQKEEGSTFSVPDLNYGVVDLNPEAAYRLVMTSNPYRMAEKSVHALESSIIFRLAESTNKSSETEFDKLKLTELRKIRN